MFQNRKTMTQSKQPLRAAASASACVGQSYAHPVSVGPSSPFASAPYEFRWSDSAGEGANPGGVAWIAKATINAVRSVMRTLTDLV